jgi:hypothetical protein
MDRDEQAWSGPGAVPHVGVGERAAGAVEEVTNRLAGLGCGFERRLHENAIDQHEFRSSWEVAGEGIVGFVAAVADLAVQLDTCGSDVDVPHGGGSEGASDHDATDRAIDELLSWGANWATIMIDDLVVVTDLLLSGLHQTPLGDDHGLPQRLGRAGLSIVWPMAAKGGSPS